MDLLGGFLGWVVSIQGAKWLVSFRSFFSSAHPDVEAPKNWKPITLRAPILGGFIFVTIGVIILLEVLSHMSTREGNGGGLVFAEDVEKLPTITTAWYRRISLALFIAN